MIFAVQTNPSYPMSIESPVKIFLHVFPSVAPWHIATVCICLMLYVSQRDSPSCTIIARFYLNWSDILMLESQVFISEMKALLYFSVKVFFHSILSIFFREVQVVGRENVPRHGPVIFTVNHANQFVDAVMFLASCEHKISLLMAEASWKRPVIGEIAWALDVVPVKRAQDYSSPGTGKLLFVRMATTEDDTIPQDILVTGVDTIFASELKIGDKIRLPGTADSMKVKRIENDTTLTLEGVGCEHIVLPEEAARFDVLQKIDQKQVYEKVLDKLASGGSVGIFPEGGSHDRTDLLPLKVGVALIAYSALDKDGLNVPIIPVGLNYFQRNRFRGRAVVEYGRPMQIDPCTLKSYLEGGTEKRRVCTELLDRIQDSMKSVLVTTPDYETLQVVYTARRLWQRKELIVSEKQDMDRRFAEGYKLLLQSVNGEPPPEWIDLQRRILAYQQELTELGIKDYQVKGVDREETSDADKVLSSMRLPYQIANIVFLILICAIPEIFLNLPVGLIARVYAERRRKKALAGSKVKLTGIDVMLTEKIVLCIVLVPTLWLAYGLLLMYCTDLDGPAIALVFFAMPISSYMGIMVAESGMIQFNDLKPFLMRLLPRSRSRLAALPPTRKQLQSDLRSFIKEIGPSLGELYHGKNLDWAAIQERARKEKDLLLEASLQETKKEK
jgi:glycerol-3-phosphate O-acyltransferase / dihydroxyacetone phosphate acyltransferase